MLAPNYPWLMPQTVTPPTDREFLLGRLAAILLGAEVLTIAGFAVFYLVELLLGEGSDPMIVIMSTVTMIVFVVGLGYATVGLWHRHPRAQAPAIAFNFLLVPLGIAMFQFASPWLAGAVLVGAVATIASTFLMGKLA